VFVKDEHWRLTEEASVRKLPSAFQLRGPEYRAKWTNGAVRFVCLKPGNLSNLGRAYWRVLVFDEAGALVEHNELIAGDAARPLRVNSLSPLRISFGPGEETIAELCYTRRQWQKKMHDLQSWAESVKRDDPTDRQSK
jgi:hypothetical protein